MSNNDELADLLEKLAKNLRENSKPCLADFQRIVDDNYWELLQGPIERPICEACRKGGVCSCYQPQFDSPTCKV